ncbi:MAG: HAMP domain-containing sensor histidine kinase, partial [Pseudomonadota bacterium]
MKPSMQTDETHPSGVRLSGRLLLATAGVAVIAFFVLAQFEALEAWHDFTRAYEDWQLDEVPLAFAIAGLWLLGVASLSLYRHRQAVTALEREVESRRAAEEAARRNYESRVLFFATASHELRTPLNAILGFSQLLRDRRYGPIGAGDYDAPIRFIHEAGEDLLATLNLMLDADKIATNADPRRAETELDVVEAIERVRVLLAGVLNRSLALIGVENPSGVERVLFDPLRFSHLVRNLLSNALKFSPSDSVVELRLSRLLSGDALLSVSDRGPG